MQSQIRRLSAGNSLGVQQNFISLCCPCCTCCLGHCWSQEQCQGQERAKCRWVWASTTALLVQMQCKMSTCSGKEAKLMRSLLKLRCENWLYRDIQWTPWGWFGLWQYLQRASECTLCYLGFSVSRVVRPTPIMSDRADCNCNADGTKWNYKAAS